jgi:glycosyltransferase involved in cell wall biosynthesis
MRVVHIITSLHPHGAQMMLYKLLSRLDRKRFQTMVVSLRDRGQLGDKIAALDVPVHTIGMKSGAPTPAAVWRLIRTVKRFEPDLIQGWMYHGNLSAQIASAFAPARVPVLWNIRGTHCSLKDEKLATAATIWLGARLSGRPAKIINNSRASALAHQENLAYRADRWAIIPNGFETTLFTPSAEARLQLRAELGLAQDALLIGLVGRYDPMKDHANFLQAASLLRQSHPQVHFVLAGEDVDRDNERLLQMINSLALSTQVHLLGKRNDMPQLTAALDMATSSSFSEGFPNVIGEAMSCGVPCVVTDVGDSGWIVGETGRVVPPRDASALAGAWLELIEMGGEKRHALGMMARRRVVENFSLEMVVRQYEALYESVVSSIKGEAEAKHVRYRWLY